MATKTVTIAANGWKYPDVSGITHIVTTSQDFTLTLTDKAAQNVTLTTDIQTPMTTTDGLKIEVVPSDVNNSLDIGLNFRDAAQAASDYLIRGELCIKCPVSGIIQRWHPVNLNYDDADAPTTAVGTFEDQFGNRFTWAAAAVSIA